MTANTENQPCSSTCNKRASRGLWSEALRVQPFITICSSTSLLTHLDKASQACGPEPKKPKYITEGQSFIFIIENDYILVTHTIQVWLILSPMQKKKHNNKTNQRIPIALGFINVEVVGDVYYGMIGVFSLPNFLFFYISFIDFRQGEGEKHQ